MRGERSYAAVHLGDGVMSVLHARGDEVIETRHTTSAVMRDGVLSFPVDLDDPDTVCHLSRTIDDPVTIVGVTPVATADVLTGTLKAALHSAGASDGVDVLEISCPATWGHHRRRTVRLAAQPVAREVLLVDTAVAAVHSVGERAPEFAVVVEMALLDSAVSAVTLDADGSATVSGDWITTGAMDLVADGSGRRRVEERVTAAITSRSSRDPVHVFVVDSAGAQPDPPSATVPHVLRRLDGSDVVRAVAGRAGISPEGRAPEIDVAEYISDIPLPVRSAAWLSEVTAESDEVRRRGGAIPATLIAVAVVILVAFVVVLMRGAPAPTQPAAARHLSTPRPPPTTSVVASTADRAPPVVPATTSPSPPAVTGFEVGRVRLELPSTWSAREEPDRLVLVPDDLPDRRIVVATTPLTPGATFDDVADDLFAEADRRGDDTSLGNLTRATDVGGRVALSYTESPDDESIVRWRVFVEDDLQIAIGCQSTLGEEAVLEDDCARATTSLTVRPN
ncbi:type VII secretion-associated protein [Rhodococcus sp. B10]|uniref:type VII secretion-associated protein n=1 Tax=Rhodococcus sp. B10 TaxID=2695876 RepID=UPI001430C547